MSRMVHRDGTLTVNTAEDGFLSTISDVAIVDVREMSKVSLYVNHVTDPADIGRDAASLDLGTKTVHCDTVIEAADPGIAGNDITIAFAAGSLVNAGELDESAYPAITFTFKTGVTTVTNFETAIVASTYLAVLTPGTGANILAIVDDDFAASNLAGGTSSEGTFDLTIEKSIDGTNYALHESIDETDFGEGAGVSYESVMSDANGMPLSVQLIRVTLTTMEDANAFSITASGELRD